jgi:hypothetical protein
MAWRSGQPESYLSEPGYRQPGDGNRPPRRSERPYRDDGYPGPAYPGDRYHEGGHRAPQHRAPQHREDRYREDRYREDGHGPPRHGGPGCPGEPGRAATGGAEGNERLTAATGAVLLVLFAAEGVTILAVRQLLTLHFFLGMLLIGPVLLKICSTGYRFVRYYGRAGEYRRKGPPAPLLRLLGPFVMVLSVAVIGTGVLLGYSGSSPGPWLFLHKATFVLWFGAMTIHVLAYAWRLPRVLGGDFATRTGYRAHTVLAGRPARWLLLTASVLAGLLLAVLTFGQAGVWQAAQSMSGGG